MTLKKLEDFETTSEAQALSVAVAARAAHQFPAETASAPAKHFGATA